MTPKTSIKEQYKIKKGIALLSLSPELFSELKSVNLNQYRKVSKRMTHLGIRKTTTTFDIPALVGMRQPKFEIRALKIFLDANKTIK